MLNLTLATVQGYFQSKKGLEKLHIFVFWCEGRILLALFGDHIFYLVTEKNFSRQLVPKLISDPVK